MNYGNLAQTGAVSAAGAGMVGGVWAAVTVVAVAIAATSVLSLLRRQSTRP